MRGVEALSAINSKPTAVVIADQLRESIIDGAFAPGDQVNEALVASRLNVSRGPVREALHRLVQEGLLLARPNRGVFVQELTARDVAEVLDAREVIECAAADIILSGGAALRHETATDLEAIAGRMREALDADDWPRVKRTDLEFHSALVAASGNSRLVRAYDTLATETLISLTHFPGAYPERERVLAGHLEIVDELRSGDAAAVHATLHQHLAREEVEAQLVHLTSDTHHDHGTAAAPDAQPR